MSNYMKSVTIYWKVWPQDRRTDKVIPMCRYASQATQKPVYLSTSPPTDLKWKKKNIMGTWNCTKNKSTVTYVNWRENENDLALFMHNVLIITYYKTYFRFILYLSPIFLYQFIYQQASNRSIYCVKLTCFMNIVCTLSTQWRIDWGVVVYAVG